MEEWFVENGGNPKKKHLLKKIKYTNTPINLTHIDPFKTSYFAIYKKDSVWDTTTFLGIIPFDKLWLNDGIISQKDFIQPFSLQKREKKSYDWFYFPGQFLHFITFYDTPRYKLEDYMRSVINNDPFSKDFSQNDLYAGSLIYSIICASQIKDKKLHHFRKENEKSYYFQRFKNIANSSEKELLFFLAKNIPDLQNILKEPTLVEKQQLFLEDRSFPIVLNVPAPQVPESVLKKRVILNGMCRIFPNDIFEWMWFNLEETVGKITRTIYLKRGDLFDNDIEYLINYAVNLAKNSKTPIRSKNINYNIKEIDIKDIEELVSILPPCLEGMCKTGCFPKNNERLAMTKLFKASGISLEDTTNLFYSLDKIERGQGITTEDTLRRFNPASLYEKNYAYLLCKHMASNGWCPKGGDQDLCYKEFQTRFPGRNWSKDREYFKSPKNWIYWLKRERK